MDQRIVNKKLQILSSMVTETLTDIVDWQSRTAANTAPGEYVYDGDWADSPVPAAFKAGKTVFLRASVQVPDTAPLNNTYLAFRMQSMEGMLSIDGIPYAGIDDPHKRVHVPRHGKLAIQLEYSSVPHALFQPELADTPGLFQGGSVRIVNREVEALVYDVRFAFDTANTITEPRRKQLLNDAIEAALLAVDLTLPRDRFLAEVANARKLFAAKIAAIAPDPESGSIYAVGHTHIDTAWLWPLKETVRKCGRTFSTALRLMETYPDFHFACSQPQLYQYTKDYYPEVYAQIKKWVAKGQWEATGAMWVEADCNATSGESLIRQMLLGIAFFKEEFGARPRTCWLPDVFGYPSSLPEILAGCGVSYFYTYKLHWQATNPFPDHLFHWRGLDGSEVLAAVINGQGAYNGNPTPNQLYTSWQWYAQKAEYPEVLFPYGFGDGGGGVTEEMIETRRRAEMHFPGLPAVREGSAEGFFDDVVRRNPSLPVWDGELYVETHRGTYTTQSALKKANRMSELMLRDAEIWGSIAHLAGEKVDLDALHAAWKLVLLSQFHDILPGSSIAEVYVDALRDHKTVQTNLAPQIEAALATLTPATKATKAVRVFNSLSWPRRDAMTVKIPTSTSGVALVASDGKTYPAQVIAQEADGDTVLIEGAEIPSIGHADFTIADAPVSTQSPVSVSASAIETPLLRIAITPEGAISSVYDKLLRREVIAKGAIGNDLQLLQDGPEREDAWNVHETIDKRRYPVEGKTTVTVIESGPVRGCVRVHRKHRDSVIEQDIVVTAGSTRIDFVTRVDWQERQTMLKVAFPVAIRSVRATYEVQFGALERPTHQNTSWDKQKFEVPAQRWADLSESGYGVSLLNDSRYGYDAKENVLRLTLLRSTTYPDPQADRGKHEFTYSLYPHAGNWVEGETVRRAWELNVPTRSRPLASAETPRSFVSLIGAAAIVEALKPAEDGRGLILRVYEPHGARGEVTVRCASELKQVVECNLVEEDGNEIATNGSEFKFDITPFQIRTFRLL
ncbi:MAG: alpha-mannosidase [Capsulimonadaceae bacterium]|nr:alpha-mannosidase [Capsulimonadaceae bacterium]